MFAAARVSPSGAPSAQRAAATSTAMRGHIHRLPALSSALLTWFVCAHWQRVRGEHVRGVAARSERGAQVVGRPLPLRSVSSLLFGTLLLLKRDDGRQVHADCVRSPRRGCRCARRGDPSLCPSVRSDELSACAASLLARSASGFVSVMRVMTARFSPLPPVRPALLILWSSSLRAGRATWPRSCSSFARSR